MAAPGGHNLYQSLDFAEMATSIDLTSSLTLYIFITFIVSREQLTFISFTQQNSLGLRVGQSHDLPISSPTLSTKLPLPRDRGSIFYCLNMLCSVVYDFFTNFCDLHHCHFAEMTGISNSTYSINVMDHKIFYIQQCNMNPSDKMPCRSLIL